MQKKKKLREIIVRIEAALKQSNKTPPQSSPSTSTSNTNSGQESSAGGKVRLPKLSLKKLTGDVTEWTAFWDAYKSDIHDNPNLTDIDQFNYLDSLLGCRSHCRAQANIHQQ